MGLQLADQTDELYLMDSSEKMTSLLSEQGVIIVIDFVKNDVVKSDMIHPGFAAETLKKYFSVFGFKQIESEIIYHQERLLMGQEAEMFMLIARK